MVQAYNVNRSVILLDQVKTNDIKIHSKLDTMRDQVQEDNHGFILSDQVMTNDIRMYSKLDTMKHQVQEDNCGWC